MRTTHLLITLAIVSIANTAAGQTPPPPPAQKSATVTTIVGCVVDGRVPKPGDTTAQTEFFVRTPALTMPVGSSVTVGSDPTKGKATTSAGTPNAVALYRLTGIDAAQLRPHLNHRVELQGHLASAEATKAVKTTVDDKGKPTTTVATQPDIAGVLHVTSVKMVSDSCK